MSNFYIFLLILLFSTSQSKISAQEKTISDPLLQYNRFFEIGLLASANRTNTNFSEFSNSDGVYVFKKNQYLPSLDINLNCGWLIKDSEYTGLWTIKSGCNYVNRSATLLNGSSENLRLKTGYLQIPIHVGYRSPIKYNTFKNNMFRAFEVNVGLFMAFPLHEKLDHPDNLDSKGSEITFSYIKAGYFAELVLSSLNDFGKGHKFGIRISNEFTGIGKILGTSNELYPFYRSIGIFYNPHNKYWLHKKSQSNS